MHSVVRTALFVPASRAERIPKALASGADAVIVDLEDAVEHLAKASAREALCDFLGTQPQARVWVRINDASTSWHDDDLKACRGKPAVAGILLPKAESLAQVRHVAQTGLPVIPILETARGILNAAEVAGTPGVARLAFGSLDYGLDLGVAPDTAGAETVLDQARVQVLLHTRSAGLAPALDGVFPGVEDQDGLSAAAARAADGIRRHAVHPSRAGAGDPRRLRARSGRAGLGPPRGRRASRQGRRHLHARRQDGGRARHHPRPPRAGAGRRSQRRLIPSGVVRPTIRQPFPRTVS